MIYLGTSPVGVATFGTLNLLHTMTFVDSLGSDGRQTVQGLQSWDDYDFLLFVPDLTFTAQDGQTNGNWLLMSISRGNSTASQYDGTSTLGKRDGFFTAFVTKGWNTLTSRYEWHFAFTSTGRWASLALSDASDYESDHFSDLSFTYGGYYGTTYALMNGTVKIYGGRYPR